MKYRARTNGNIVELSDEAAAQLVPGIYEPIEAEQKTEDKATEQPKGRKPR